MQIYKSRNVSLAQVNLKMRTGIASYICNYSNTKQQSLTHLNRSVPTKRTQAINLYMLSCFFKRHFRHMYLRPINNTNTIKILTK